MEHRIIWLMITGEMPKRQTDHRNEIKDDNRFDNLREATNQTNRYFVTKPNADNKGSGLRGVYANRGGWRAMLRVDNRLICLGTYKNRSLASEAYVFAKELALEHAICRM